MTERGKLESLDTLRGIAILMVIVAHFFADVTGIEASLVFGNAGVILFFHLSGFLMDRTLHLDGNLWRYATRRLFRILPMYWISLALVAVLTASWSIPQLIANATFTAPVTGHERMLGVYWTLYIEMMFYAIAPLLILANGRVLNIAIYALLGAIATIMLLGKGGAGAPFYLLFCLCGMQIGAWSRGAASILQIASSMIAIAMAAKFVMPVAWLGLAGLACGSLLILGLQIELRSALFRFLGAVSYSWYLLHSIVGYRVTGLDISQQSGLAIGAVGTLALSYLTYRAIELPMIKLGKNTISQWADAVTTERRKPDKS